MPSYTTNYFQEPSFKDHDMYSQRKYLLYFANAEVTDILNYF